MLREKRQAGVDDAQSIGQLAKTTLLVSPTIEPVADSLELGARNVFAVRSHENPHHTHHTISSLFWITMPLTPTYGRRCLNGMNEEGAQEAFAINVAPPDCKKSVELDVETELLHLFINPALIDEVASELAGRTLSDIALQPLFNRCDNQLSGLLRSIGNSLLREAGGSRLMMDYLSRALCANILLKYAVEPITPSPFEPSPQGLGKRRIARLQDYLESHLARDIQLDDMASVCGISRNGFIRRFKASKGMTPHQYVIQMRVKRAQSLLTEGEMPLTEIAVRCGFSDHSHFANTFRIWTGVSPKQYRDMR
ncbi:helix-turn-helix domain-containing protein [Sphingomonas quercus]|uniref:AraC family transcriptional regulator n=1 Tax=Sphingomonas quercus TaxID=2842451 RepID=A0ABS6BMI5_9SPHN|nr:AraC family transcriptional regulator [Sphingomonas quercus]MBU3079531.1 AraC family transcriptional regulator [Sphingomonas quercus]